MALTMRSGWRALVRKLLSAERQIGNRDALWTLDFPPRLIPRFANQPHPELWDYIRRFQRNYRQLLGEFLRFREKLQRIVVNHDEIQSEGAPYWDNEFLPALDAIALYGILGILKPRTFLEIGSGHSTRFANASIKSNALATRVVSIDPSPRSSIDALCDEVIRAPLEDVDLNVFDVLERGDVLFVDGTHRVFTNSDVTVFFLEVLPRIKPGVWIEIHDVCLPWDYSEEFARRYYAEQYMLATTLLFGGEKFEVLLANAYISNHRELVGIVDPIWGDPRFLQLQRHGGSFWFRKL